MKTLRLHSFYLAIIGDIVRSRDIPDRKAFQQQFHRVMDQVNRRFQSDILSPFTVTLGDEFQALLTRADSLFTIQQFLRKHLAPQQLVFGVGIGEIETDINRETSIGMDGPCFRLAREQVEAAKTKPPRMRFAVQGVDSEVCNTLMRHIERLEDRRTPRQREIIQVYQEVRHQQKAAARMGISQAAVSQALESAGYFLLEESRMALTKFIGQFLRPIAAM